MKIRYFRCEAGHVQAWSENELRRILIEPTCRIVFDEDEVCRRRLGKEEDA